MTAFVVLLCKKEGSGFPLPWCRSQYRLTAFYSVLGTRNSVLYELYSSTPSVSFESTGR